MMSRYWCDKKQKGVMNIKANEVCLIRECPYLKTRLRLKRRRKNGKEKRTFSG